MNPATQRPESLSEIANRADSIEAWSLALGDFLDEIGFRRLRGLSIASCLQAAPTLLRGKFAQGELADAFAAALAEQLALRLAHKFVPAIAIAGAAAFQPPIRFPKTKGDWKVAHPTMPPGVNVMCRVRNVGQAQR